MGLLNQAVTYVHTADSGGSTRIQIGVAQHFRQEMTGSNLGRATATLTEVFSWFSSVPSNAKMVPHLGHYSFRQNPFQFIPPVNVILGVNNIVSLDSAVGIATGFVAVRGNKFFSSSLRPHGLWGPTSLLSDGSWAIFP